MVSTYVIKNNDKNTFANTNSLIILHTIKHCKNRNNKIAGHWIRVIEQLENKEFNKEWLKDL